MAPSSECKMTSWRNSTEAPSSACKVTSGGEMLLWLPLVNAKLLPREMPLRLPLVNESYFLVKCHCGSL